MSEEYKEYLTLKRKIVYVEEIHKVKWILLTKEAADRLKLQYEPTLSPKYVRVTYSTANLEKLRQAGHIVLFKG